MSIFSRLFNRGEDGDASEPSGEEFSEDAETLARRDPGDAAPAPNDAAANGAPPKQAAPAQPAQPPRPASPPRAPIPSLKQPDARAAAAPPPGAPPTVAAQPTRTRRDETPVARPHARAAAQQQQQAQPQQPAGASKEPPSSSSQPLDSAPTRVVRQRSAAEVLASPPNSPRARPSLGDLHPSKRKGGSSPKHQVVTTAPVVRTGSTVVGAPPQPQAPIAQARRTSSLADELARELVLESDLPPPFPPMPVPAQPSGAAAAPAATPAPATPASPTAAQAAPDLAPGAQPVAAASAAAAPRPASIPPSAESDVLGSGDWAAEIDARFEATRRHTDRPGRRSSAPPSVETTSATTPGDMVSIRALFDEMAARYMSQVRDFMLEVRYGEASTEWIAMCEPAIQSMRSMCDTMEMLELAHALDGFAAILTESKATSNGTVDGDRKDKLLASYARLIELLPQAFELDAERDRREPIIVQSLLMQIPDVQKLTIDKIYRAGLHRLESFLQADPDELASVAGISPSIAGQIVEKFRDYKSKMRSFVAEPVQSDEHDRLKLLVGKLRAQHDAFEAAASGWSEDEVAQKRNLRRACLDTLLQIQVALARLGEVDRIGALERLPVQRQIEDLERFLQQTPRKSAAF